MTGHIATIEDGTIRPVASSLDDGRRKITQQVRPSLNCAQGTTLAAGVLIDTCG